MTGTDLYVNKCKQSRSYLNHLVYWYSYKVPVILCQMLMKIEFSRQTFKKSSNFKFHENPSSEK